MEITQYKNFTHNVSFNGTQIVVSFTDQIVLTVQRLTVLTLHTKPIVSHTAFGDQLMAGIGFNPFPGVRNTVESSINELTVLKFLEKQSPSW
ncbi:hypothetical protein J6590_053646 [Homalodisca vitripennis]|nr:hypothetical protein J6590_053646 [Homalodisca vitripennis]